MIVCRCVEQNSVIIGKIEAILFIEQLTGIRLHKYLQTKKMGVSGLKKFVQNHGQARIIDIGEEITKWKM